ncbi:MAG: FMN-binding protein [Pirellulaceae bacterium]
MASTGLPRRTLQVAIHGVRGSVFVAILCLIHWQHARIVSRQGDQPLLRVDVERIKPFFPKADSIGETVAGHRGRDVFSKWGYSLGYLLQTSPDSDHIVGFSGPTNVLIAFSTKAEEDRILGLDILSSRDTLEHVEQVLDDESFLTSFNGLTWGEAAALTDVDGVSGATLTSLAIAESIIHRLGGGKPSLRFSDPLTKDLVRPLFTEVEIVEQDPLHRSLWHAKDASGTELGTILRTSPAGDNIVGFAGPTEALVAFGEDGCVTGICLAKSYDTEPYVTWVREDKPFHKTFNGLDLNALADLDLRKAEVEGVSGATMTSLGVAETIVVAAIEHREDLSRTASMPKSLVTLKGRDFGTIAVVVTSILIAFTPLRTRKTVRVMFRLVLIAYLGLINGDMLSQAMLVGWSQSGIPWRSATGLVVLTAAALLLPVLARRNIYCGYLCPHGAAQRALSNRLPWRFRLPRRVSLFLSLGPAALLLWCIVVALAPLPYSLVDIEPFNAWVLAVAGWATMTVAVVGLIASLFVPMAYCRYGCPTGMVLSYLKFHSRSDRWTLRDWTAVGLLLVAIGVAIRA